MRIAVNRKTLAEVDAPPREAGLPVNKICANCRQRFTTVDTTKVACKFCRAADDDLRRRIGPPAPATARKAGAGRTNLWSADMIAALRAAVAQKRTSKQIADALNARFGLRLTRNAVIGKCKRLEIQRSDKSKGAQPKPNRAKPSAPKPLNPSRQSVRDRGGAGFVTTIGNRNALPLLPASNPPQAPLPRQPDPAPLLRADGQPHTMLSLLYGACKWPVSGDGKHTKFCGHVVAGCGEPYCETHAENSVTRAWYSGAAK